MRFRRILARVCRLTSYLRDLYNSKKAHEKSRRDLYHGSLAIFPTSENALIAASAGNFLVMFLIYLEDLSNVLVLILFVFLLKADDMTARL